MKRSAAIIGSAVAFALVPASAADASRAPTKSEAKAIKKGFLKGRPVKENAVRRIRVSTANRRYASVRYVADVAISTKLTPPGPVALKKSGSKWKPVSSAKVPAKPKKDLKLKKATSDVRVSGEVNARFTRPARCSASGVSIYDPGTDLQFSIQQFQGPGNGLREAKGVGTVVAIYRNRGTELAYESGAPSDASQPSGSFFRHPLNWGYVDAELAAPPVPTITPLAVKAAGAWDCG